MVHLLQLLPSWSELGTAVPVILSLVMIEGLLSVDNAMGIAAMAANLPKNQQTAALRWGIFGAYGLRGLCLFAAGWIASNPWIKIFGAAYLLWLAASGLVGEEGDDEADAHGAAHKARGFLATVISIEIMDLTLSIDNVVAAVALDKRLWVVCTGVFIGILALRFVAGYAISLMERFPILEKTAFLLIGFVGCILCTELTLEHLGIAWEIGSFQKFIGIALITMSTLAYSETVLGKKLLTPLVTVGDPIMHAIDTVVGALMITPIKFGFGVAAWPFKRAYSAYTGAT